MQQENKELLIRKSRNQKFLFITQHENTSEAKKWSRDRTENGRCTNVTKRSSRFLSFPFPGGERTSERKSGRAPGVSKNFGRRGEGVRRRKETTSLHPPPRSPPPHFSPSFCSPQALARFFARLFALRLKKKRNGNGCYAGYAE